MIYNNQLEALKHIFLNHEKLFEEVESGELIDLESQIIKYMDLRYKAMKWPINTRFMLYLALNLFGLNVKVDLNRIDKLNQRDRDIALTAIRIRYDLI